MSLVTSATIPIGKLSQLFDHKSITLSTKKKPHARDPNKIKDSVLDAEPVKLAVELAVKEFYLNNADPNSVPRFRINTLRYEIGQILNRLRSASSLELNAISENNMTAEITVRINELLEEARDLSETLPPLSYFENLPLAVAPDVFFEELILSVKNEVLSKQATIFKIKKYRKSLLVKRIGDLKKDVLANHAEIFRQELVLNNLIESELRAELLTYKKFERLNQEKITPYFMKLAAVDNSSNIGLENICDDNGNVFPDPARREEYISNFYANLYCKPIGPERNEQCITEFLSDILDTDAVRESKISQADRERLDSDLQLEEFDEAVEQIKSNTSPGIDGISNRFIKRFWYFFRTPLFNYARHCLDGGKLTENFRSAKVRLIPKKGDPKKISNWRPISLLNCFYKVVSRVLTLRLRTVIDKITCIGQKGYSKSKFSQEVLITIFDKIANAKKLNRTGCVVSLDIKKAFDSLSHNFMGHALSFFNIGDRFISWIKTICTDRKSCIIVDGI
jgi:hypothetical protein